MSRPYKSTHLYGQLVSPAAPTVPFVEAAGLVGLEHAHYRDVSIPNRPYKKIEPLLQTFSVVVRETPSYLF